VIKHGEAIEQTTFLKIAGPLRNWQSRFSDDGERPQARFHSRPDTFFNSAAFGGRQTGVRMQAKFKRR